MKNIVIKNNKELKEKIDLIKKDGVNNIHVVSDFDRTLTYGTINGEKIPSIMAILRMNNYLGEDYSQKADALYNYYHVIEVDPSVSKKEKKIKMKEWWEKHVNLLIEKKLKKEHLEDIAKNKNIVLRRGVVDFLKDLKNKDIPLVIFSASGCGEAVEYYFKKNKVDYKNIVFFINRFLWDGNEVAVGIREPKINASNKDETSIKQRKDIYEKIKDRKNIILLGDSIGDIGMAEGFDYNTILKIGFLNNGYNKEGELESYLKNYDIVIKEDSDFKPLYNNVLKNIL